MSALLLESLVEGIFLELTGEKDREDFGYRVVYAMRKIISESEKASKPVMSAVLVKLP